MTTRARQVGVDAATTPPGLAGLELFVRYAYPPNELGYCGPDDHDALFDYGTTGVVDRGLVELAAGFTGPWPYLTVMAGAAGLDNPFDQRVVEAYWIGNDLLDRVATGDFGRTLTEHLKPLAGDAFPLLEEGIAAGGVAHHSFHVFGVYPWLGMLRAGEIDQPLHHLDRCRIRWGRVEGVTGDTVEVSSQPLVFDGVHLELGPWQRETVTRAVGGAGFVQELAVGDWVAMHWHWVCSRLDDRQLRDLRRHHRRTLDLINTGVSHSGPGLVMAGG